jgi:ABC-type antimicrobial peptide transport system permease subunit
MGEDQNDMVIVPWTTMRNRLARSGGVASAGGGSSSHSRGDRYAASSVSLYPARDATQTANYLMPIRFDNVDSIQCKAVSADRVDAAMEEISALLRARHRIREGEEDDFVLHNMSEMLDALTSTSALMTSLLLIVALISLVVGGVGIMNIMLVSVTERTREIGLRMAVGARGGNILVQFLVESLLLCVAGGVLGIAAGRVCSMVVSAWKGWPVAPSAAAIAMSVAVSATIGVAFGFYPAWRASRLNPIDALRYE